MKLSSQNSFMFPNRAKLIFCCFLLVFSASALAQSGFTGIFGGGPLYINATNNIAELQNSGFTEVIVWSVEVKTNGDLNLNGEFPLTSNGVYIGDQTHPDFASNMASAETRNGEADHLQHRLLQLRRLARCDGAGQVARHRARTASSIKTSPR